MADIVAALLEESERFFHLGLRLMDRNDEMYHEHRELIDALLARDSDQAHALAAAQIRASEAMVINALMASPALLETNICG